MSKFPSELFISLILMNVGVLIWLTWVSTCCCFGADPEYTLVLPIIMSFPCFLLGVSAFPLAFIGREVFEIPPWTHELFRPTSSQKFTQKDQTLVRR